MSERRYEATLTRIYAAPRELVWALVADTDRWDRAAGLNPGAYAWRQQDGSRQLVGRTTELGFDVQWVEAPYQWIEGSYVHGERQFEGGPVTRGGFTANLRDVAGGTEVVATAYVASASALTRAFVGPVMRRRFRGALARWLDSIAEVLKRVDAALLGESDEPAAVRVRRALMAGYDPVTSGPRTPPDETELERRVSRLASTGLDRELVERLRAFLKERPDEEVAQIRPFEVARAWKIDRRDALRGFLHATRAGLVDLRWQLNCPVCRVSAEVASSLDDVDRQVHCEACNISYDLDFGEHVEAVFQSNPAIREVATAVYCASSPAFRPHVFAQLTIAPGGSRDDSTNLPPGTLLVRPLAGASRAVVDVKERGTLAITIRDGAIEASLEPGSTDRIRVANAGTEPATIVLERIGWHPDAALGTAVASFPDFLDLFATEAPASGVELTVGHLALLFSDLTGSTALYERIGDARAFAIVEEHFRTMEDVVRKHEGAIVKTMGDAVMASFRSPAHAVAAALEMAPACDALHGSLGLAVKLGVHAGPCLAVRANDRLDYFGTTVNLAARLQAKAGPGELVLTEEVASQPDIAARIGARALRRFEAGLKGISAIQRLVAIRCLAEGAPAGAKTESEGAGKEPAPSSV